MIALGMALTILSPFCRAQTPDVVALESRYRQIEGEYFRSNYTQAFDKAGEMLAGLPQQSNARIFLHELRARASWRQSGVSALAFRSEDLRREAAQLGARAKDFHLTQWQKFKDAGQYPEALFSMAQAIAADPRDIRSYNSAADLYRAMGDQAALPLLWDAYVAAAPDDYRAYYNRGNGYSQLKRHDQAIADFSASIKLKADFPSAYVNRGLAAMRKGDCAAAIADFSVYIDVPPSRQGRGICHYRTGAYGAAVDDLTEEKRRAFDPMAIYTLASARYAVGDLAGALDELQALQVKAPGFGDARRDYGLVLLAQGRFAEAHEALTKALQLTPDDTLALRARGLAKLRLGAPAEAVGDMLAAYSKHPTTDAASLALSVLANARNPEVSGGLSVPPFILADKWPRPILSLYDGSLSRDAFMAAAKANDDLCRGYYYVGQLDLVKGEPARGKQLMRKALEACPPTQFEHYAARVELAAN